MNDGFIKLSRKFFEHEFWKSSQIFSYRDAWIDLIQAARFEDSEAFSFVGGKKITWNRGEFPASVRFLSARWRWSEQSVRTFISKLKKEKMITVDTSQGSNILRLCNYDYYNSGNTATNTGCNTVSSTVINTEDNTVTNTATNTPNLLKESEIKEQPTQQVAQQLTQAVTQQSTQGATQQLTQQLTQIIRKKKEYKKEKLSYESKKKTAEEKLIAAKAATSERAEKFRKELVPFVGQYRKEMIRAFFNYWTEPNKSHTKMKFEQQNTWCTNLRLANWANREKTNPSKPSPKQSPWLNHDNTKEIEDF